MHESYLLALVFGLHWNLYKISPTAVHKVHMRYWPHLLGYSMIQPMRIQGLFTFFLQLFLRHSKDRANVMYWDFIACWISLNVMIFLAWPIDIASLVYLTALTFLPDLFKVCSHRGWITQMINYFLLNTFVIFYCEKSTMTLFMTLALQERISGKYKEEKKYPVLLIVDVHQGQCDAVFKAVFAALMDFGCWHFFKSFCERGVLFLPILHIWNIWGL